MYIETASTICSPPEQENSAQQISAYYLELDYLLDRVEHSITHYQVLGLDRLSTTGEIKVAYLRASAMLNPSRFGLDISIPDNSLERVDLAFENISQAFSVLVSFQRRLEYDEALRQQPATSSGISDQVQVASFDDTASYIPGPARPAPLPLPQAWASNAPSSQQTIFPTSKPAGKKNRRKFARFKLSIPVLVTGYENGKGKWRECTQTIDLSQAGVLLRLTQQVKKGKVLHVTMPMPEELRQHNYNDPRYSMYAVVRRVEPSTSRQAFVALEFLGENPPSDYIERP